MATVPLLAAVARFGDARLKNPYVLTALHIVQVFVITRNADAGDSPLVMGVTTLILSALIACGSYLLTRLSEPVELRC